MKTCVLMATFFACCLVAACDAPPRPPHAAASSRELTPDSAKECLIALIRSGSAGNLEGFPLEKYEKEAIKLTQSGQLASWGPFDLDIVSLKYSYSRSFGEP